MPVYVYQIFEIKQEKFKEAIENLQDIKKYRNDQYDHTVEILVPISGHDYSYAIFATYEALADMEIQNRKMYDDDDYLKLLGNLFLDHVVQGSMQTQIYRGINKKIANKNDKEVH